MVRYQECLVHLCHKKQQWEVYKRICDALDPSELVVIIDFTTHVTINERVQDLVLVLKYRDEIGADLRHDAIDYLAKEQKEDGYYVQIALQHFFGLPDLINGCDPAIANENAQSAT